MSRFAGEEPVDLRGLRLPKKKSEEVAGETYNEYMP